MADDPTSFDLRFAPGLLCQLTVDGLTFLAVSPAWSASLGWPADTMLGRTLHDFIHPDDRARTGVPGMKRFNSRFKMNGGGYRWLSWQVASSGDGLLCVVHDITEHSRAEERLAVQYAVARLLAEAATVAEAEPRILEKICEADNWDLGALWWVDRAAATIRCAALWHRDARPTTGLEDASRGATFRRGDGIPGYVWASGAPVWIPDFQNDDQFPRSPLAARDGLRCACAFPIFIGSAGREEVVGVIELFSADARARDDLNLEMLRAIGSQLGQFARRRHAEDSLRDAERRLEFFVAHAALILVAVETDGRIVFYDGGGLAARGQKPGELVGQSIFDLLPASHPIVVGVRRALAGEAHGGVLELSDEKRSYEVRFTPVRREDGRVGGVIGVAMDVSERKAAETAMSEAQVRLLETDRLAALGTLATGMVHEINNALTYVSLNLGRLLTLERSRERPSDPLAHHRTEILDEAHDGVRQVARVMRDLKTFANVESREKLGPVKLSRVLDSAIRVAAHTIRHRANLVRDYGPGVPPAHADAGRLGQVFLNLLVNAAQSIPPGEAHLNEIQVTTRVAGEGRVAIEVRDTGTGISPEIRARIFDPFFTTKPSIGTGLGLSISRSIIDAMGGEISVDSMIGGGTTFRVVLPASVQPSVEEAEPVEAPLVAGPGPRGRVLVVDDDRLVLEAIAAVLRDEHDVVVSGSGREALALLQADNRFDAIVCDVMLAEVSGADVYDALQLTQPELVERFILVTAGAFTPEAQRFVEQAGVPCVDKPFPPEALRSLVRELVSRRAVGGGRGVRRVVGGREMGRTPRP